MRLKILFLEDSKTDAELIQRELNKGGIDFEGLLTDNKLEFTNALVLFKPDIILSDHAMPGFDSIEALSLCKANYIRCPFILVTGAVSEEFAVNCIKSGADDYILKNKLTRLPSAVLSAINKAKTEQEKERAVKNLEEQNVFMNLLLKSIPIAHYVCKNDSHKVTYISNNIFSFSGYHPESFENDLEFWNKNVHPDDLNEILPKLKAIIEKKEWVVEYRWKVSDGTYRWILDRARIVDSTDISTNSESFIAGAMIDITLRKETEEKLILKNKELNTFIYRSTHDLRGPLMTILGLTNVALDEDEMNELRNYIKLIDECTHKLDDVLLSLITTVSLKDSQVTTKEIDIKMLIHALLLDCESIEGFEKIKFSSEVSFDKKITIDDFALISILKNVIENAIKYQDFDKISQIVSIKVFEFDNALNIIIEDNGLGIPEKNLERVFDMFFRGTQICKGSGLGLYIVKNAVEKLQGSVRLESKEGEGTTVKICLPI